MSFPDELKFLEKPISFFKFDVQLDSIARCILWTLLFLGLAHYHSPQIEPQLPYAEEMTNQNLTPLSSAASDPRWSRNDLKKLPENSVAWIAGSSIAIKPSNGNNYIFLPSQIKTDENQYVSLKMARRMLDTYTMVKDAITRKPSAMVIVINPFWELHDTAAFFKTNLMNEGTSLWANESDWPLIPLLASPGNILWAAAGQRHNLIANSYDYLKTAQVKYDPPKQKKVKGKKEQKLSYNQPALFWMMNRYNEGKNFKDFDTKAWQVEVMAQNNIEQSQWGKKLLKQMLETIKDSNIPTLVYLAPINPELERTPARVSYRTIKAQISETIKPYANTNIRFITLSPRVVNSMTYIDHLHLSDSGRFPAFLHKEISDMIKKR